MNKTCIVIPTYNEAANLPRLVTVLRQDLPEDELAIIVVDDNSSDGTAVIAEKLREDKAPIILVRRPGKLGVGSAVRQGLRVALSIPGCNYIVSMDADFSHDPKDVRRLLMEVDGFDLVQGSRYVKGGKIIGWSPWRRIMSYGANLLCRFLFRTGIHEYTTFLRVYSRKCAEIIVENTPYDGNEWSIASILATLQSGCKIKEIPITFINRAQGKSKLKSAHIFVWLKYTMQMFANRYPVIKSM